MKYTALVEWGQFHHGWPQGKVEILNYMMCKNQKDLFLTQYI